ncbi:MAG: PAAR domain-containing protein, partial [Candidatus Heimdallarchaeaceae archaeon]
KIDVNDRSIIWGMCFNLAVGAVIPTGKVIVCVGDTSDHGGTIINSNQDGTFLVAGVVVAVDQAQHSCPIAGHGVTAITAITTKSYHNGKLILTSGAVAGCGAVITPPDRSVIVE